jgi:hypothetical protein
MARNKAKPTKRLGRPPRTFTGTRRKRGEPRTRADAPGVATAARQPRNPKPPAPERRQPHVLSDGVLKKLVLHHIPAYARLEARVRAERAILKALKKEIKTEGGPLAVAMVNHACKLLDEQLRPELDDKSRMDAKVRSWVNKEIEGVPDADSETGLEAPLDPIDGAEASAGGDGGGDAQQSDERPGFYDREAGATEGATEMGHNGAGTQTFEGRY